MAVRTEEFKNKKLSVAGSFIKICRFCAYQERSHLEVRNKLFGFGISTDDVNEILSRLVVDGYLNEERFAKAFAGGKFRVTKWGRNKIIYALEGKGLTANCIRKGLKEIDDAGYRETLTEIIRKKNDQLVFNNAFQKRDKIARFAISRGYEPDLVWEIVKAVLPA